jgi:SAM-dependent methyltransferase
MPNCPMCNLTPDRPPVEEGDRYALSHCSRCDLVWADPMRSPGPEWYAEHPQYQKTLWFGLDAINWNHRQFFKNVPARGGRLLDVGCGSGRFLFEAARRGYIVTGLDFNREAIEAARRRFGLTDLHQGSLEDFVRARPEDRFDVVTAFEVLEHLENPKQFFAQVCDLLRSGGYLGLSTPYRDRWPRTISTQIWDRPPHHLTRWSKPALATALSDAGFRAVKITTGWLVGAELIHYYVRFGMVDRLFRRASRPDTDDAERQRLATGASRLMRLKRVGACILGAPINVALKALGSSGLDMFGLATKP